ncbi:hemolysin family protein [Motilibacter deserti]|uniref:HlyC/CorC family transporter n=1 Tax=Motilibacter deserti TaxID=2714956 RepID=A0ABX0GPT9_9ACTN|nr:HlyC/CorC family transporter [Motilibacter deserti]
MSGELAIAIAVALLLGNAFFVGAEFALVGARRSAIEPRAEAGSRAARTTLRAMEEISLMLAGAQLGVTVCSLGLGSLGEPAVAHYIEVPLEHVHVPESLLHPIAFVIALSIVAFLHIVLGEMVPKNLALVGPDRAALLLGPALMLVVRALHPVIVALNALANGTLRAVRIQPKNEVTSAFTRDEVAGLVEESRREGLLEEDEERLIKGALSFEERGARSVLLPTAALTVIDAGATPAQVEELSARTGYSRFPVRDGAGGFSGYVHVKDVLEVEPARRAAALRPEAVRPLPAVRETDPLRQVLTAMQRSGSHLARVHGADGGLVGVVALEDVIEELVGEIRDEAQKLRR